MAARAASYQNYQKRKKLTKQQRHGVNVASAASWRGGALNIGMAKSAWQQTRRAQRSNICCCAYLLK